MGKYHPWARTLRFVRRQTAVSWIFFAAFAFGVCSLFSSICFRKPLLSLSDKVALSVGMLGAAIVWWQGYLIAGQIVLGTVVDLYKEWNSEDMLGNPNPETIEEVLEFLEKVSTLQKNRFVTRELVWDTFGWYLGRYFFYCKSVIEHLRREWTREYDPTLYQDLEKFYPKLLRLEVEQRNEKMKAGSKRLTPSDVEADYQHTRRKFIKSEVGESGPND
jgi:hypothetical protein